MYVTVDTMYAVKVAERIHECMMVIGQTEDCFRDVVKEYRECVEKYNLFQKEEKIVYEEMRFDYSTANKCDLCLHHCDRDRDFVMHLGRQYHPECVNIWMHMGNREIPVYIAKEESMN